MVYIGYEYMIGTGKWSRDPASRDPARQPLLAPAARTSQ